MESSKTKTTWTEANEMKQHSGCLILALLWKLGNCQYETITLKMTWKIRTIKEPAEK